VCPAHRHVFAPTGGLGRDARAIALKLGGWRGSVMVELLALVRDRKWCFPLCAWVLCGRLSSKSPTRLSAGAGNGDAFGATVLVVGIVMRSLTPRV